MQERKKILNVGGSSKEIAIPSIYAGWDHILFDIMEGPDVDIVGDARDMDIENEFDAIYLSHTLEHIASKDVPIVLNNFKKALKQDGHVHIRVPNFGLVVKAMAETGMDLQQPLYVTQSGPVTAQDIIFGSPRGMDRDSEEFMIHRTGFTEVSLKRELETAGFDSVTVEAEGLDLVAIGWAEEINQSVRRVVVKPMIQDATVTVGFAHNGFIRHEFYQSLRGVQNYDFYHGKHIVAESSAGGPYITQNRNLICQQTLTTPSEWLWMLDTDVAFPPEILDRILEVADSNDKPIIGAVYFTSIDEKWMPVWLEDREEFGDVPVQTLVIGEVRELSVIGMGCTLIHRSVLEKMQEEFSDDPWPWFGHDIINNSRTGEDVTFCHRAKSIGFPTHGFCYPLTHMKTYPIDWKTFHDQYRLLELDTSGVKE